MRNWSKIRRFAVYFSSSLLVNVLITCFIGQALNKQPWALLFYKREPSSLPLLIYLVLFSLGLAAMILAYLTYQEHRQLKKMEEALQMIVLGNYSAPIFLSMFEDDDVPQISTEIDRLFLQLHEKLLTLTEEAVAASDRQAELSKETRDEILEQERHRISRELHDSVSQQLFAASMLLSAVNLRQDEFPEELREQLQVIEQTINESQSEMRALLLHLRPVQLAGKSLKQGIEQLLQELATKVPLELTYQIEAIELPAVVEDHLFRIVQELLSNVLRHAQASELEVYFTRSDDQIRLRMVDDGVGFDTNHKKTGSYGLSNVRERIERLGGNVRIVSFPGQGTNIEITLPKIIRGESI